MDKPTLVAHLGTLLRGKLTALDADIASALQARNSDTKSSAGDKHEVGRAMVQQELDRLEAQRAKWHALLHELARVPLDRVFDRAGFGSLVTTEGAHYFIAIGLGQVEVGSATCSVVSLASPIGQALQGARVGDAITFQGKRLTIHRIV